VLKEGFLVLLSKERRKKYTPWWSEE